MVVQQVGLDHRAVEVHLFRRVDAARQRLRIGGQRVLGLALPAQQPAQFEPGLGEARLIREQGAEGGDGVADSPGIAQAAGFGELS